MITVMVTITAIITTQFIATLIITRGNSFSLLCDCPGMLVSVLENDGTTDVPTLIVIKGYAVEGVATHVGKVEDEYVVVCCIVGCVIEGVATFVSEVKDEYEVVGCIVGSAEDDDTSEVVVISEEGGREKWSLMVTVAFHDKHKESCTIM